MGILDNYRLRRRLESRRLELELERAEAERRIISQESSRFVRPEDDAQWINISQLAPDGVSAPTASYDHYVMLDQAWKFYYTNPFAKTIIKGLCKFVLGKGPTIAPVSKNGKVRDAWAAFVKENRWSRREKEMARRTFRDGEVFMRFIEQPESGVLRVRFVRSNFIANPRSKVLAPNVTYGIETEADDIETPVRYFYCDRQGNLREEIPAADMMHVKIESDSDMKRGFSFLLTVMPWIKKYESWLEDRIALNKARSAIALVRTVEGAASAVESIRDEYKSQYQDADKHKQQALPRATVLTASKGISYSMLSPNINASDVRDDGRAILLAVAAGCGFPEMFLTADYCHDMKTEVLTEDGFLFPFEARNRQCKVASVNESSGALEYQYPVDWVLSAYDGDLYHYAGNRLNFAVTRNHKMWLRFDNSRKPFRQDRSLGGFMKCTLSDTNVNGWRTRAAAMRDFVEPSDKGKALWKNPIVVPRYQYPTKTNHIVNGSIRDADRKFDLEDMVRFVGWFVSEGFVEVAGGGINLCQSFKNKSNLEEIDGLLSRMPVEFFTSDYEGESGVRSPSRYWRTGDMALAGWLRCNCGSGAENKHLPRFTWSLSSKLKGILLDTLIKGDGSDFRNADGRTWRRYYSTSKRLIDDVQRLAFELGFHATSRSKQGTMYVDISDGHNCMVVRDEIEVLPYKGLVWCATVPNGLLVTRRNGRILISGNSNANYSSTMVAQNPFVREIEDWQDFFEDVYAELFARVVAHAKKHGEVPAGESEECTVEWPPLILANITQNNQAREIQHRNKIISKKTWQQKEGLDPATEELNMEEEQQKDVYKNPFSLPDTPINQYPSGKPDEWDGGGGGPKEPAEEEEEEQR